MDHQAGSRGVQLKLCELTHSDFAPWCYSSSLRLAGRGRLPTLTLTVISLRLRKIFNVADLPGSRAATRFSMLVESTTSLDSTATRISPGLIPARSAGPPRSTPAINVP